MRLGPSRRWLSLLTLLAALAVCGQARAGIVEPKVNVMVREKPTTASRIVDRIATGKKLQLLGRSADGRWTHVQTPKADGWVPTGQLKGGQVKGRKVQADPDDEPAEEEEAKPLAKRRNVRPEAWVSKSRYHDGEDSKLTVSTVKADLFGRPAAGGAVLGILRRGDVVNLVRRSADKKWILVDIGGGESAWIEAKSVKPGAAKGQRPADEVAEDQVAPPPPKGKKFVKREEPEPEPEAEPEPPPPPAKKARKSEPPPPPPEEKPPEKKKETVNRGDDETPPGLERKKAGREEEPPPPEEKPVEKRKKGKKLLASRGDAGLSSDVTVARRGGHKQGKNHLSVSVRGGVAILQQRFTSNEVDPNKELTNFEGESSAASISIGLGYQRQIGKYFLVGFDGGYNIAPGSGLRYQSPNVAIGEVVLQTLSQTFGLAANVGMIFNKAGGIGLRLRAGFAGQSNQIQRFDKLPLPSELILGFQIGLALDVPAIFYIANRPFGIYANINGLLPGVRLQTAGLAEGTDQETFGASIGAGLTYGLVSRPWGVLGLMVGYNWWLTTTQFAGQAQRILSITSAARGNAQHDIQLGLYYSM